MLDINMSSYKIHTYHDNYIKIKLIYIRHSKCELAIKQRNI